MSLLKRWNGVGGSPKGATNAVEWFQQVGDFFTIKHYFGSAKHNQHNT